MKFYISRTLFKWNIVNILKTKFAFILLLQIIFVLVNIPSVPDEHSYLIIQSYFLGIIEMNRFLIPILVGFILVTDINEGLIRTFLIYPISRVKYIINKFSSIYFVITIVNTFIPIFIILIYHYANTIVIDLDSIVVAALISSLIYFVMLAVTMLFAILLKDSFSGMITSIILFYGAYILFSFSSNFISYGENTFRTFNLVMNIISGIYYILTLHLVLYMDHPSSTILSVLNDLTYWTLLWAFVGIISLIFIIYLFKKSDF